MTEETKSLLRQYEEKKIAARELEAEIKSLQEALVPMLPKDAKIVADYGTFTIESRPKWVYSPETTAREKAIKETKKREEAEGIARKQDGDPYLVYRSDKE